MILFISSILIRTALLVYAVAMLTALIRVIKGPTLPDRTVAFDTIGVMVMSIVALLGIIYNTTNYLEAILIIGILSFISTVAISRFIERGNIFGG